MRLKLLSARSKAIKTLKIPLHPELAAWDYHAHPQAESSFLEQTSWPTGLGGLAIVFIGFRLLWQLGRVMRGMRW